ncbi:MAG: ABC transporter permease subunit [Planctomycetota bacterium]|nr:ABC transporter permease subunit [Planctomycetota bacterium]
MNPELATPADDPKRLSVKNPPPLKGFAPVFTWGSRLAFRPRRFLLIAAVAVGLGALVGISGVDERSPFAQKDKWFYLWELLDKQTLQYLLPLCALLFVTPGFSNEVSQRTLVYHLVRPVSRSTVFLARFASGVLPAVLVGTLLLWSVLWTSGLSVPTTVWMAVPAVAALSALLLGSLYYMLASIFRKGMIAALVYTFVIETMFIAARGSVQTLSMSYHVRSLYRALVNDEFAERSRYVADAIDPDGLLFRPGVENLAEAAVTMLQKPTYSSGPTAVITAIVLSAAFLAYGVWRTKRRDFPLKD